MSRQSFVKTFGFFRILSALLLCSFSAQAQQFSFSSSGLKMNTATVFNPTSIQFGPDGRLYVSEQAGWIRIYTIRKNGPNNYEVTGFQTIGLINQIPNHNDDGSVNTTVTKRQVTGILVKGTAANPVIYVSSSDSRIGGPSGETNLDTNSGIISMLTWDGTKWVKVDLVRGLPRSEENHAVNGMQIDDVTNTMFIAVGGHTNAGAPSTNFAYTTEYALSAAILSVNLNAIMAMPTKGTGNTAYKYDLPTLDDPTRANNADGTDVGDPFGGNDGLNQAMVVQGGPVQIYSGGWRNCYDLVLTKSRKLYAVDNGANQGWGGYPANEGASATNNYVQGEPGSTTASANHPQVNNLDNFHYIGAIDNYTPGAFYAGHPTPIRANPAGAGLYTHDGTTGVFRTSKTGTNPLPANWPPVPVSMADPREGFFKMPGTGDGAQLTFKSSTNGIAEYTASAFGGALKGHLLAAEYNGDIALIKLTADGTDVLNARNSVTKLNEEPVFASNFGSTPLDLVAQGDNDPFPGTVWALTYGADAIVIFEPQENNACTGANNTSDEDGDGYTNADELANGSNPCSGSSKPADFDGDKVSDLNDADDDNDGINDTADLFAIDASNGRTTTLPVTYNLFNNDPGKGFFGLGFNGLMSNGSTNYRDQFNGDNLVAGGAVGAFSVVSVSAGDALGALNTQQNGFQFGVQTGGLPFTLKGRILGPFFNNGTPTGSMSQGIYLGNGDQDNYLKIVLNANGGAGGIQVVYENAGVATTKQYAITGGIPGSTLDLILKFNPATNSVQAGYSSNSGAVINVGTPIVVSGAVLAALKGQGVLGVGVIATSKGGTPFTATWDYLHLTADPVTAAGDWTIVAPASGAFTGREENAYVQAGDKFYLIGGRGNKPVQEYNPVTKTWTNKAYQPLELHHFQAVTLDGLIYVAGAFTGGYPRETPVPNMYIYNPASNKWHTGPSIPAARRRGAGGAAVHNGKIYLVSGITDGHWAGWVKWFDEYDPATGEWKTLPDAPHARDHVQVTVVNNKLYVAGGRRSSAATNQDFNFTVPEVDVYDFATGTWTTLPAASNIPTPRSGAANVVVGDEVIVIGGETATQVKAHNETEALNVHTHTWRTLDTLETGRHGTQAIATNGSIYIATGAGNRGGTPILTTQEVFHFYGPTTPDGTPLTQSQLSVPTTLNVGSAYLNNTAEKALVLTNTSGNQALLVSSITVTGSAAFGFTAPMELPFVIPAGGSVTINVTFTPTAAGAQTANLVVAHSGSNASTTTVLNASGGTDGSNEPPVGDAGPDKTITLPTSSVVLNGSGSDASGTIASYAWTQVSGPNTATFSSKTVAAPTVSGLVQGTYVFQLVVKDNDGASSAPDQVTVTVNGAATGGGGGGAVVHRINAGGPQLTTSIGTFVADKNFAPTPGRTTTVTSAIANTTDDALYQTERWGSTFSYALPVANGQYEVVLHFAELTATTAGRRVFDVSIEGVKKLDNYDIFAKVGALTATKETFTVNVTDGTLNLYFSSLAADGGKTYAKISAIEVLNPTPNAAPVANAGPDNTVTLPANSVTLNGSGTDTDGTIASYSWTQVSGPGTATFSNTSVAAPTVSGLVAGTYLFALVVTDNNGAASVADQVGILVNPAPTGVSTYRINAGGAQVTNSIGTFSADNYYSSTSGGAHSNVVAINGTTDDAIYQSERWGYNFGYAFPVPSGSYKVVLHFAEIYHTAAGNRIFDVALEGTRVLDNYDIVAKVGAFTATTETFTVSVTDGTLNLQFSALTGEGGKDNAKVSAIEIIPVTSSTNMAPKANAGADKAITLPTSSVMLQGTVKDADGTVVSVLWSQVSGPNTASFSSKTILKPTVSGLVAGTYKFALVCTDNAGAQSVADEMLVVVSPAAVTRMGSTTPETGTALAKGGVTETSETDDVRMKVYPNPTPTGPVQLVFSKPVQGELTYTLHAPNGTRVLAERKVLAGPTSMLTIHMGRATQSSGIYFLEVVVGKRRETIQIMVTNR
ncbi:malectin domain-containing carbohydrate-binding protein [Flaviaesturariibacter amylovorans]|uniref:PKD/Chitinase domain-containing protein n=1 Tax=Flaviaesturariibacter amylovorans TaxID=1084520 RepID=A0ABP8HMY8_9BACT